MPPDSPHAVSHLAAELVAEVKRLLAAHNSYRVIQRKTGVSRGTIGAIATGKRPDYKPREPHHREQGEPRVRGWCGPCGVMVMMPCRACRARAAPPAHTFADVPEDELRLELAPEEAAELRKIPRRP
jgi:hypothetical protein